MKKISKKLFTSLTAVVILGGGIGAIIASPIISQSSIDTIQTNDVEVQGINVSTIEEVTSGDTLDKVDVSWKTPKSTTDLKTPSAVTLQYKEEGKDWATEADVTEQDLTSDLDETDTTVISTITDSDFAVDTTYVFRIASDLTDETTVYSNETSFKVNSIVTTPVLANVEAESATTATLTANVITDSSIPNTITANQIFANEVVLTEANGKTFTIVGEPTITQTDADTIKISIELADLDINTAYAFSVTVNNNNESFVSADSNVITTPTALVTPVAPTKTQFAFAADSNTGTALYLNIDSLVGDFTGDNEIVDASITNTTDTTEVLTIEKVNESNSHYYIEGLTPANAYAEDALEVVISTKTTADFATVSLPAVTPAVATPGITNENIYNVDHDSSIVIFDFNAKGSLDADFGTGWTYELIYSAKDIDEITTTVTPTLTGDSATSLSFQIEGIQLETEYTFELKATYTPAGGTKTTITSDPISFTTGNETKEGLSTWIYGIIAGSVAGVLLLAGLGFYFYKKKNSTTDSKDKTDKKSKTAKTDKTTAKPTTAKPTTTSKPTTAKPTTTAKPMDTTKKN